MNKLSLKERFPGIDTEGIILKPDDVTELTYSVLVILKELATNAFNAATTRRAIEAQELEWAEALRAPLPASGEIMSLYLSDRFGCRLDGGTSGMAQRTLDAIQAAKGHKSCDVKQTNGANRCAKQSVLNYSELLLTEQMVWDVIAHTITKSNGPFEMGECIVAFNTFDGYDAGRDYSAQPPTSPDEKELVGGIEELIECFTFTNKRLTREVYEKYLADCQKFQVLILNYVIRELELCEFLKPLGLVQLNKDSEELMELYLVEVQPTPEEGMQARWVLPYKHVLKWDNKDDKVLLMVECVDHKLEGNLSDMYLNCTVFIRDMGGTYELEDEMFVVAEQMYIVLGFQDILELFVISSDASMKRFCDYLMTTLNARHKERAGQDGKWMDVYEACNRKAVREC